MYLTYLLASVLGYLLGSFPTGYLVGRLMAGVDVRKIGSGRTGGSNVLRSAGKTAGLVTIFGDIGKGTLAVILARLIFPDEPAAFALAALFSVVGHNHSIFLKFKGGAGTMTAGGALLGLDPLTLGLTVIIPITLTYITRTTSIGSLLATAIGLQLGSVLIWQNYLPDAYFIFLIPVFLLSWETHRPNIRRLMAGNERRIGKKT